MLRFNSSLLRGERLALRLRPGALSPLQVHTPGHHRFVSFSCTYFSSLAAAQVLLNASQFCLHPLMRCPAGKASCPAAGREWYCPDPLSHGALQRRRGATAALERWPVPLGSRWRVAPTGLALRGMSRTRPGHVRDLSFRRVAPTGLALRRPSTRRTRQGGPPAGSRCPSLRRSPRTRSRSISRRCEGRRPSR